MIRRIKGRAIAKATGSALLTGALLLASVTPAYAVPEDEPTASEMAADVLIARPVGAVVTAVGAAFFVLSLPFSAAGGNLNKAAETLVVSPARETFVRCLGCRNAGRYSQPKE